MRIVDEGIQWGVYKAYTRGKPIMDDEGNFLNIASRKDDRAKMRHLVEVAQSFGLDEITLEWLPGTRQVTDEEYEEQIDRMANGLVPDRYDLGNLIDEHRYRKQRGLQ